MKANLELYKIFCVVATSNSFSQAARELYISQSAVSQAMNQLENQLGVRLLLRSRKGVVLNENGVALNTFASQALGLLSAGEARVAALKKNDFGMLRICAGETICQNYLVHKLKQYSKMYPNARLDVLNNNTHKTIEKIRQGKAEIGFVNEFDFDKDQFGFQKIYGVHDVFVCSNKNVSLKEKIFSIDEISNLNLIMLEKTCAAREYIDNYATQRATVFCAKLNLSSTKMLIEFAKAGFGVSCVAREYCVEQIEQGELFELKHDMQVPQRNVYALWLKDIALSVATERFIAVL